MTDQNHVKTDHTNDWDAMNSGVIRQAIASQSFV